MTTRYRQMQISGWGVTGGEWKDFTDDELAARMDAARAAQTLDMWLNDPQTYVEVFRNGDWRPASIRAVPLWEHASKLEIAKIEGQAAQLRKTAGKAYEEQATILEAALLAVKEAEARVREQRERVAAAETQKKAVISQAKKLEGEAASKKKDFDKRIAMFDAATSPKTEAVPA